MKFSGRIIICITLLALISLPLSAGQAVRVRTYGCLVGNSTSATILPGTVFLQTNSQALNNAMVEDIGVLDSAFGVNVSVYFLNDGKENAFFTPIKFDDLIRRDGGDPASYMTGSVFFGFALLNKEFRETNGNMMSVPAILAHEFAHAMQYKNDFPYEGKLCELHADFLAGWYVGHRARYRPTNAMQAFLNFFSKGDYDFFGPGHHGTPQERAAAFKAGYDLNRMRNVSSAVAAYRSGLQYVVH